MSEQQSSKQQSPPTLPTLIEASCLCNDSLCTPCNAVTAEIKRLERENTALRNLAENLKPGPISEALVAGETPAPRFSYSREWLERSLAIADDSTAGAGGGFDWSCFVCGQATGPDQVAVAHMVHAGVVCCKRCKAASERGADDETSALPFQRRVTDWMMETFSMEVTRDTTERNHRFLEESLELVQALGCTPSEAHMLVDYVYGRPVGDPQQEVGGVLVTLAALCNAADFDYIECGEQELARCWQNIARIRAKHAGKPHASPLPGRTPDEPTATHCPKCGKAYTPIPAHVCFGSNAQAPKECKHMLVVEETAGYVLNVECTRCDLRIDGEGPPEAPSPQCATQPPAVPHTETCRCGHAKFRHYGSGGCAHCTCGAYTAVTPTPPQQPPVDNEHVAEGCERFGK